MHKTCLMYYVFSYLIYVCMYENDNNNLKTNLLFWKTYKFLLDNHIFLLLLFSNVGMNYFIKVIF